MIMHFYDKAWSICCTNSNYISVGLVLMLLPIIQWKELREWHPSGVARTKIRSYQWKFQWNFDQGKGNLVWVNREFEFRLQVVPHLSSRIVERAKRECSWKSPHARKCDTQWGERKMRDYRQSPSFWTYALLSQHKTLIGSSMEICQHLSKTRQPLSTLDMITIYTTNN